MESQTLLFYSTLFVLIILEVIVIYLIAQYYKLLKSYDTVMAKQRSMDQDIARKSQEMLQAAEQQASAIVATAHTKAQQMLASAEGFDQQTQTIIQQSMQTFLKEQTDVYRTTFDTIRKDVLAYVQELNQAYRQRADQEIVQINDAFSNEMKLATKTAQETLEQAYQRIEKEVELYRQQRLKNVDEQIKQLTTKVMREVLHQAIDTTTQEQLIMEALHAAHKDGIV